MKWYVYLYLQPPNTPPPFAANPSLIPRSSVISGKFKYNPQVIEEQIILEREMEEIRIKNEQIVESMSDESEELIEGTFEESEGYYEEPFWDPQKWTFPCKIIIFIQSFLFDLLYNFSKKNRAFSVLLRFFITNFRVASFNKLWVNSRFSIS